MIPSLSESGSTAQLMLSKSKIPPFRKEGLEVGLEIQAGITGAEEIRASVQATGIQVSFFFKKKKEKARERVKGPGPCNNSLLILSCATSPPSTDRYGQKRSQVDMYKTKN